MQTHVFTRRGRYLEIAADTYTEAYAMLASRVEVDSDLSSWTYMGPRKCPIRTQLCYYDPRNPNNSLGDYDPEDKPSAGAPGCGCDNCFYGRNQLAVLAIDLQTALEGLVQDWERVTGAPIPEDHEAKAALAKLQ